jgi:xylanolytic transcriptional activator XlnR
MSAAAMMAGSLHPYAPSYSALPSNLHGGHRLPQHIATTGLETLAEGSHYALHQLQHPSMSGRQMLPSNGSQMKSRYDPYAVSQNASPGGLQRRDSAADNRGAIRKNSTSAPVRRRISRACDQCNQLRTKCDGKSPCAHCIGGLTSALLLR